MPAHQIKESLVPYRLLAYLLYAPETSVVWLKSISPDKVQISTAPAARALRMRNTQLWRALEWLELTGMILGFEKQEKRGSCIIHLRRPTNISIESV